MGRIFFLCMLAFAQSALAVDLDLGVGKSYTHLMQDGQWWQSQNGGYSGTKNPVSYEIALRDTFPQSFVGWSLGYLNMGKVTADNIVTNVDGETYDATKPCNQATASNCLAKIRGEGGMKGVFAGITLNKTYRDVSGSVEYGRYYYRSYWHADVTNIQWCAPLGCGAVFRSTDGGSTNSSTAYYGVTLRYKFLYVSDKEFQSITQPMGLTAGKVRTVTAGVSYQF